MALPTKRILSGIQPTGNLHLGNYLGAIKNWVALQEDYESLYCIVDMHAITTWQEPAQLAHNTREVAAGMIAAGISPDQNTIFVQSHVPGHMQLAWVFNCIARMGWLSRMTQYKDKAGKNREKASVGLFVYPNLMAADILIYKATHVPVGEDQKQHLELTRDIATKFNTDFGKEVFPLPQPVIRGPATRVMSLRNGMKKMSKSEDSDYSRINMTDDPDTIVKKIRKAKTDPDPLPNNLQDLKNRPEAENLINIYAALADVAPDAVVKDYAGQGFGAFKSALGDLAVSVLSPIASEMNRLMDDQAELDALLSEGAEKAGAIAADVVSEVYGVIGFMPKS